VEINEGNSLFELIEKEMQKESQKKVELI